MGLLTNKLYFTARVVLCTLLILAHLYSTKASHLMGGELLYDCLGGNQYEITLKLYRDCGGNHPLSNQDITIESESCNDSIGLELPEISSRTQEVSPLCPDEIVNSTCNGGNLAGTEQYVYQDTVTLPQECTDWVVSGEFYARNDTITNIQNPGTSFMHIKARINNANNRCNTSPEFTNLPVPYICDGNLYNYNHGAVDSEGDSLVYSLIPPLGEDGDSLNFEPGLSWDYPINTESGSFSFDSTTGRMLFAPDGIQVGVLTVEVKEYRDGDLIGSVMRDIQVRVDSCSNNPPVNDTLSYITNAEYVNQNTVEVCAGADMNFWIPVTDPDGDTVSLSSNVSTSIPDAGFADFEFGDTTYGYFAWEPGMKDQGLHSFTMVAEDDACPSSATQIFTYNIRVKAPDTPSISGPSKVCPYDTVTFNAHAPEADSFVWDFNRPVSGVKVLSGDSTDEVTVAWGNKEVCVKVKGRHSGCTSMGTESICKVEIDTPSTEPLVTQPATMPDCGDPLEIHQPDCKCMPGSQNWKVPSGFNVLGGRGTNTLHVEHQEPACMGGQFVFSAKSSTGCKVYDTIFVPGAPLSSQHFQFSARYSEQNQSAKLQWKAKTGNYNDHFIVYRSSGQEDEFEQLAKVQGKSSSGTYNVYNFQDTMPVYEKTQYKIKRFNSNGKYKESRTVTVLPPENIRLKILNNPFVNTIGLVLKAGRKENANLYLTDLHGKLHKKTTIPSGKEISLGKNLSAGIYIIRVVCNNQVITRKVIKEQ